MNRNLKNFQLDQLLFNSKGIYQEKVGFIYTRIIVKCEVRITVEDIDGIIVKCEVRIKC